jgi:hypothetical protein
MYFIFIGAVIICIINYLFYKLKLLEDYFNKRDKNLIPLEDERYLSLIEDFKKNLGINLKTYLLYNPKALQENCRVKIIQNTIYIIVDKAINEERIRGSIAHELGHIVNGHPEKDKLYLQNTIFLINILLLTALLYPVLNLKIYLVALIISACLFFSYHLIIVQYLKRKEELEADAVAVRLIGAEYLKCLNASRGANKIIGSIPFTDHPTSKARLRHANRVYKSYSNL